MNEILTSLVQVKYQMIIDVSPDTLTIFACQFGRHRYRSFSFGAVPVGNMFQRNTNETFRGLRKVFRIAHNILVV